MKKIISLLAAASMSALALVSCIKEDVKTTGETFTVNFLAQTPETKTLFGEANEDKTVPTLWETDDAIALICNLDQDKKAKVSTTDGTSATFSVDFDKGITAAEAYTFYAAYPYTQSPVKSGKVKIEIPKVQAPENGRIAKDAMGLVAKSEAFTAKPTEPVTLSFKHAAAYGCITKLDGVPAEANISSIKISSDNNIVGTFLSDCESTTLTEDSASNILTINTNAHNNIWFSVAPFEGGKVKFEVITDDGTYVVEKDFTGKKFEAGKIARFGITGFTKSGAADVVYTLVKSVDELVEGANVIIAVPGSEASTTALGTTQNSNNRNAVSVTLNTEKNIINPDETVEVLTIGKGLNKDTYSLYANTTAGYLYAAGAQNPNKSQNYLKTEETLSINSSWTISIATEGVATIKTAGTAQSHTLKKNSSSALYACYTGGQTNVAIYIDQTSVLPALKAPEVIAIKNGTTIDVAWDDVENATEYVVSCTGQADQTVNAGVEEASFTNLSDGDYVVTVTAKADGYKSSTGSAESIHIGKLDRNLAYTPATATITVGDAWTAPELTGDLTGATVSYSSDNTALATVAADGTISLVADATGTATITAIVAEDETYAEASATYTITVKEASQGGEVLSLKFKLNSETTGSSSSTYVTTAKEFTTNNVSFVVNQWNPSSLQIKCNQTTSNSNFQLRNTTAIPGKIRKISIIITSGTFGDLTKLYISTSSSAATAAATSGTNPVNNNGTLEWTFTGDDTYFTFGTVKGGMSGTVKADDIIIEYE